MAIVTNTLTRYDAIGIREDLSNIIYNISPETTPFVSNMSKRRSVKNTYFEWQTDSLSAAAANKQLDGDDVGSFTAVTPTARLGNYTQIMRKVGIIADNLDGAIDEAGRRSELAYQITKQGNELKRDVEYNLVGVNAAAAAGATGTARATASLSAFIRTNTSKGSSGADPTVSSGVVNAARTDGTARAISETLLKGVLQSVWTQGGDPKFLMVGAHVKTVVSSFSGIAAQRYMAPSDSPTTIIGAADVYMSDFGSISIVPNRFSRARDAYVIDPDLCELATLRPMQQVELAKTGDATKFMMLTEVGLQINQEAGLGIVADLSTS